jgi:hypothetical protein
MIIMKYLSDFCIDIYMKICYTIYVRDDLVCEYGGNYYEETRN